MFTLKPSDLRPTCKNRVNFDHHRPHKKQVNRSSHSKQVNFGPHTVNFDPPHKNHFTFHPNTVTKSNSTPHTKIEIISTPVLKSSQFDPHSKIKSTPMLPHKIQFNFDLHTKTKNFSPPHENQVNSDPSSKF